MTTTQLDAILSAIRALTTDEVGIVVTDHGPLYCRRLRSAGYCDGCDASPEAGYRLLGENVAAYLVALREALGDLAHLAREAEAATLEVVTAEAPR